MQATPDQRAQKGQRHAKKQSELLENTPPSVVGLLGRKCQGANRPYQYGFETCAWIRCTNDKWMEYVQANCQRAMVPQ